MTLGEPMPAIGSARSLSMMFCSPSTARAIGSTRSSSVMMKYLATSTADAPARQLEHSDHISNPKFSWLNLIQPVQIRVYRVLPFGWLDSRAHSSASRKYLLTLAMPPSPAITAIINQSLCAVGRGKGVNYDLVPNRPALAPAAPVGNLLSGCSRGYWASAPSHRYPLSQTIGTA